MTVDCFLCQTLAHLPAEKADFVRGFTSGLKTGLMCTAMGRLPPLCRTHQANLVAAEIELAAASLAYLESERVAEPKKPDPSVS